MDVIREIYRGDIFYVMPGPAYAAEIGTKGRPAVIVSPSPDRTSCETVNVVYLTTRPQAPSPVHVRICSSDYPSTALCEQVNAVHIDRLGNFYAAVTGEEMRAIDRALLVALGLDPEAVHEGARKEPTIAGGDPSPSAAELQTQLETERIRRSQLQEMYDCLLERMLSRP